MGCVLVVTSGVPVAAQGGGVQDAVSAFAAAARSGSAEARREAAKRVLASYGDKQSGLSSVPKDVARNLDNELVQMCRPYGPEHLAGALLGRHESRERDGSGGARSRPAISAGPPVIRRSWRPYPRHSWSSVAGGDRMGVSCPVPPDDRRTGATHAGRRPGYGRTSASDVRRPPRRDAPIEGGAPGVA